MYPVIAVTVSLYSMGSEVNIISATFSSILTSHHWSSESSSSNCEWLLDSKTTQKSSKLKSNQIQTGGASVNETVLAFM